MEGFHLGDLHLIKEPDLQSSQCPPFLTINLSQIIYYDKASFERLNTKEMGVRDRIVLVGQSFSGNYDFVSAPMHNSQQLPGVYLHATVLENLLTMNENYDQVGKYGWTLVLGLAVFFSFLEAFFTAPPRPWVPINDWRYWIPAALCIFLITSICFRWGLHWPLGMVPSEAFHFTFYLFIAKILHEGKIYEWVDRLFGIDPHHKT